MNSEIVLREYQARAVEALRENIRSGVRNQILSAPTGSGKTMVAAHLLKECYEKGKRAVFCADRIPLIDQTSATLDEYGIPHGVIQASHWRRRGYERVQVASAQTLQRRQWPDADLVIVDEAHGLSRTVINRISRRDTITIGLTATPFSRGLGKYYDAVVSVTTTNKLIQDEFLVPFRVYAASEPDMSGAKVAAGEWTDSEAADRSMPIVGDCVAEYLKHGAGKKFIAFGCTIAHCEELQRQFLAAGVVCELYVHGTPDSARREMVEEFRKPESYIRGLVSVAALSKGFDVSDVEVIIMARPLRSSLAEHIQILGRGLRIHPGKSEALILDHAGNMKRFWADMQEFFENGATELDDGKPKPKKKPKHKPEDEPLKCPKCACVHARARNCPSCGHIYSRPSNIEHQQGELIAFSGRSSASHDERQRFYSELCAVAAQRGYKPGWAFLQYQEKYKSKPTGLSSEPIEPTPATLSWVKSRMIAWAKRQEKERKERRRAVV